MKSAPIPAQSIEKRIHNYREVELGLTKRVAIEEARKFPQSHVPHCQPKCPLGIDILEFVRLLREGEVGDAYKKIREANALPGVCGRTCYAPCEEEFIIGGKKMPIDVRALERFVADYGRPKLFGRDKLTCEKEAVAVIGSGPAGLAAAELLAKEFYCVTVFESMPFLGGILRYGIPEFRLPNTVVDAEVDRIRDCGVEFQVNCTIGRTLMVDQLFEKGFKAFILAMGRSYPDFLNIAGTDAQGVFYGAEVLMTLNTTEQCFMHDLAQQLGDRVIVIGNRDAALDCARACRRLGKDVRVVFEGTEENLDMHRNEIFHAREEGVIFEAMVRPLAVSVAGDGHVDGLECQRMDFADKKGEWVLVPVPGNKEILSTDSIIIAQGNGAHPALKRMFPDLKQNSDGTVWIDEDTGQTSLPQVFAAGDLVDARAHVLDAMVCGRWAAERVMAFFRTRVE